MSSFAKWGAFIATASALAAVVLPSVVAQSVQDRLDGIVSAENLQAYSDERAEFIYDGIKPRNIRHIYVVTTAADKAANDALLADFLCPDGGDVLARNAKLADEAESFLIPLGDGVTVTHYAAGFAVTEKQEAPLRGLFQGMNFDSMSAMLSALGVQQMGGEE